jgi:hypothetical protein
MSMTLQVPFNLVYPMSHFAQINPITIAETGTSLVLGMDWQERERERERETMREKSFSWEYGLLRPSTF